MAKYRILKDGTYKNNETGYTGIHQGHWMFDEIQKWLDDGNVPDPEFTPEEITVNEKRSAIVALAQQLLNTDRQLLKLLVTMYKVGLAKGLWVKADFTVLNPAIINDVQTLITTLTELETLENS